MTRAMRLARRLAIASLLLLATAAHCFADTTYDTFLLGLAPTNYWPLIVSGADLAGGNNGTCTGTCNFGQTLAPHVSGLLPATPTSTLNLTGQAFLANGSWAVAFWFTNSNTTNETLLSYTGSDAGLWIRFNEPVNCAVGQLEITIFTGAFPFFCSAATGLNDGKPHFVEMNCFQGTCATFIDGNYDLTLIVSWTGPLTQGYSIANRISGGPFPVTGGSIGGLTFFGTTNLSAAQINGLYRCGMTGSCFVSPPNVCPMHPGSTKLWCDSFDSYLAGFGFALGGCGIGPTNAPFICQVPGTLENSNGNTFSASQSTNTLTLTSGVTGAAPAINDFIYDSSGGQFKGGNNLVNPSTYITAGSGPYTVSTSESIVSENMGTGTWFPGTFVHNVIAYSGNNAMVVGESGGALGNDNTVRWNGTTISEGFLEFHGWFTAPDCGDCGWSTADFGFTSLNSVVSGHARNCGPCVRFGGGGHSTAFTVFDANFVNLGSTSVKSNVWHDVVLAFKATNSASDYVRVYVDGIPIFSHSGADSGPASDAVTFDGAAVGGSPDAEAYFDDVGVYNGPYVSGGPMLISGD